MQYGLWTFPWDLIDGGVEKTLSEIQSLGINEISVATNYHAVRSFHPHNPDRAYYFSHARSYFEPDDRFNAIEPVPSEDLDGDWIERITETASGTDLDVNSWTIGCHNSVLGERHPDETIRNCFDDSLRSVLCPSRPAVQEFLVSLVEYLSETYAFERIELESFDYCYGTGYGWHHDKYHAELGTLAEFLLGVCFCDHCVSQSPIATSAVDSVKETCRRAIRNTAEGSLSVDVDPLMWLRARPDLAAHVDARAETLHELYIDLADAASDCELVPYVGILDVDRAWVHGLDLAALEDVVDGYVIMAYESTAKRVADHVGVARELTDADLRVGLRPGYPNVDDPETVRGMVETVESMDVNGISFYNYGLLSKRNLQWIAESIAH